MARLFFSGLRRGFVFWGACFCAAACVGEIQAGDAYYVLVFGSQRTPPQPNYSHSFATFVHAHWEGDEPCPVAPTVEAHTISWLPANLIIRTLALLPECGHNFDLETTLQFVQGQGQRVSLWGPYQIEPDLYHRAMRQIALLESGQVRYRANDTDHRTDDVSNCIHAVSSIVEGYRLRVASPGWGEMASHAIMKRFRPWIIDEDQVHFWVGSALGLDNYPIIYRDGQAPRSAGLVIGPVNRLLGRERNLQPSFGPPR
jgi:hypothetical protein